MSNTQSADSVLLRASNLVKKYDDKYALNDLSLSMNSGETIALIGPNGAGKTTTIESILGLREPDSGSITIFGIDAIKYPKKTLERIGVHLQDTRLFIRATTRDYLKLFQRLFLKTTDVDELIRWLDLGAFMDVKIGNLSGGMRQRLSLALALINDPDLVILDEPTVGLDPIARQEFWGLIRKLQDQGKALLFSTHYMEEATQLADRIILIHDGCVVYSGSPAVVIEQAQNFGGSLDATYRHYVEQAGMPAQ